MKKIIILAISIICIFVLAGCSAAGSDASSGSSDSAQSTKAKIEQIQKKHDDPEFWDSLNVSAGLIRDTVETDKTFYISVRLKNSDGSTIILEDIYQARPKHTDDSWRNSLSDEFAYSVAASEEVMGEHEFRQSLKVTGLIFKWEQQKHTFSICDLEADGEWDYATEGIMFFTDVENNRMPGTENEYGAIGVIDINPTRITSEFNTSSSLSSVAELVINNINAK